jgi:hypothetical protein
MPCPHCAKPIRRSAWQALLITLALSPLAGATLWLSKAAYSSGSTTATVIIFITGLVSAIYLQRYIPVIHDPARGRE